MDASFPASRIFSADIRWERSARNRSRISGAEACQLCAAIMRPRIGIATDCVPRARIGIDHKGKTMNVLGIILARGGSEGLKGKHLRPLCGKPVIEYTFDHANSSRLLTRTVVSTD